ncbi:MAG: CCA tRNA nucleotidyltransferase [Solirubrobacterales bacterium]
MALKIDPDELGARIGALPGIERLRGAAAGVGAHIVGGAVRDLMLGRERVDLDVVVEGDAVALARALDPRPVVHERFGTATVRLGELSVDLASARSESYPRPGALPEIRPGSLAEDLSRRDFTVNAMAVSIGGSGGLTDPHGGAGDLASGTLRALHGRSLGDDPTRGLRAARYAARLGFALEPQTEAQIRGADLGAVSAQRVEAELRLIAAEASPVEALRLAAEWGLLAVEPDHLALLAAALDSLNRAPWPGLSTPAEAVLAVIRAELEAPRALAELEAPAPADAVEAAHGHTGTSLLLAMGLGAEWVERYVAEWRHVRPSISGHDLIAVGVPEGPAVGRGLRAALRAKLAGDAPAREDELRVAIEAAG